MREPLAPLAFVLLFLLGIARGSDAAGASDEFIDRSDMDLENLFQGQFDFARPHFLVLNMDMIGGRIANRHRAQGVPVIAWTARSADDVERVALQHRPIGAGDRARIGGARHGR